AARTAAEKARRDDLLLCLLEENGRWQDLASLKFSYDDPEKADGWLCQRADYLRLAGREKESTETLNLFKKQSEKLDPWWRISTLCFNGRPDQALALMGKNSLAVRSRFETLVARMCFNEALRLDETEIEEQWRPLFQIGRAQTLHFLGRKEEAKKLFA